MSDMVSFIVVREDGERVGSSVDRPLPVPGDFLLLRHPDDAGPTWEVIRREFVGIQDVLVVVREVPRERVAAQRLTNWI